MSEQDKSSGPNSNPIIRDPALVKNRIFVGNLPTCTREELESICHPYGKVLGSLVQKNFGFVQFESEELANKIASALHKSTFKGHIITVRNAGSKPTTTAPKKTQLKNNSNAKINTTENPGGNGNYNDCEIIVVNRLNTKYAEYVEERLKRLNLRVDLLFPNEDVPLGKVLSNISSRGCLYSVLVTGQHEEHNSITVNILYGQPAEHRNMPLEDAIKLIGDDFNTKMARDGIKLSTSVNTASNLPQSVPIIPAGNLAAPPLKERHPDQVQALLTLLADNMPLTVLQYDRIIKYLQERRELQLKVELGDVADESNKAPDPEIELQKKILDVLNKPSVTDMSHEMVYPNCEAVKADAVLMELLKDVRIQNALISLMSSNLVKTVGDYMKF